MLKNDLKIEKINNKKEYRKISEDIKAHFLQSWDWGNFKSEFGWDPVRVKVQKNNEVLAVGQFLIKNLSFGYSFSYFPMGPAIKDTQKLNVRSILVEISNFIKKNINKNMFTRFELPIIQHKDYEYNQGYENGLKNTAFKKAPNDIQVRDTRKLKLTGEKNIWENVFNSNHRRKIRKAYKSDITIENIKDIEKFNKWYNLNKTTAERGGFFIHPYRYYLRYFENFIKNNMANLYAAYYKEDMVAGIIVSNYNKESIYQYGASKRLKKNIYVNEALQWHAIKEAINKGSKIYDFWGVAPDENDRSHPWYGITRFKRKFGGNHIRYIGAYDYPQKKIFYQIFGIAEKLRKRWLNIKKKFIT